MRKYKYLNINSIFVINARVIEDYKKVSTTYFSIGSKFFKLYQDKGSLRINIAPIINSHKDKGSKGRKLLRKRN